MPGANCSVFGCGTSRRDKGISLFKLPAAKDKFTSKWRDELLSKITRDRVLDADFRRQIKEDRPHICERHFEKDKLYICKLLTRKFYHPTLIRILNIYYTTMLACKRQVSLLRPMPCKNCFFTLSRTYEGL